MWLYKITLFGAVVIFFMGEGAHGGIPLGANGSNIGPTKLKGFKKLPNPFRKKSKENINPVYEPMGPPTPPPRPGPFADRTYEYDTVPVKAPGPVIYDRVGPERVYEYNTKADGREPPPIYDRVDAARAQSIFSQSRGTPVFYDLASPASSAGPSASADGLASSRASLVSIPASISAVEPPPVPTTPRPSFRDSPLAPVAADRADENTARKLGSLMLAGTQRQEEALEEYDDEDLDPEES